MPRVVSFIVLVAILLLMGSVFFQVMAQYVVPLFLAAVLVVIFKPLHWWVRRHMPLWPRAAALITTLIILFGALLPSAWLGWKAYVECRHVYDVYLSDEAKRAEIEERLMERLAPVLAVVERFSARPAAPSSGGKADGKPSAPAAEPPAATDADPAATPPAEATAETPPESAGLSQQIGSRVAAFVGGTLLSSVQTLGRVAIGLAIMMLALYYFFLDGPSMISTVMRMSPLDDAYERELLDKFANVSRAVVVASLASAVVQGTLAGVGYYFALNAGAPVFLLTMVTMLLAIVPFVGAAAVWAPTALWIFMFQSSDGSGQGDAASAIALALYGAIVVSSADNLIKPLVLHGQSNLHPLLALISVLGGVEVLGPIGILVGPMLVAFFQALVNMVNKELVRLGDPLKHPAGATAAEAPSPVAALVSAVTGEELAAKEPAAAKPATKGAPKTAPKPRRKRR